MGKGDIRSRRGKIWRGTYGVTRPRRWKSAPRPAAISRKVKTLKDLPKAVAEEQVKKIVAEVVAPEVLETHASVVETQQPVAAATAETVESAAKKTKKAPAAKKPAAAKKAPAKKKK